MVFALDTFFRGGLARPLGRSLWWLVIAGLELFARTPSILVFWAGILAIEELTSGGFVNGYVILKT